MASGAHPRIQRSWNEIRAEAVKFSKEHAEDDYEKGETSDFLTDFFAVFGLTRRRVSTFEHAVKKHGGGQGFVDLFWPGVLLVEMKSRGKPLDRAYSQALDYFPGILERDLPRYVLVSDFARFVLHDLDTGTTHAFDLADLHKNVHVFGFMAGYTTQAIRPQDPINIRAAKKMGDLHDLLEEVGYSGHELELYLVRLLFCFFADDTGIFEKGQLHDYIEGRTSEDGSDLGHHFVSLFHVLNTPETKRLKNLDEELAEFPFVNGKLFEEQLAPAAFDRAMRETMLELCGLDWSAISPAVFGSLFQSIKDKDARRNLGAHYTSEENILKLIKPLFLDALRDEFEKVKSSKPRLREFHQKLARLTFLDPACGCGNFLVITYRELRLLELDVVRALNPQRQLSVDLKELFLIDVDQFCGIEIDEFPAQIAQVALWLTDHQMNQRASEEFGLYYARIPLRSSANIRHANALAIDWAEVLEPAVCSYVLGNPPFIGHQWRSAEQVADVERVWGKDGRFGRLDYVACWHRKAADYMAQNPAIATALVSTNSICQGEQVDTLWTWLLSKGVVIHFAHRTFAWTNEAPGKAAVHCVIVGFALRDTASKTIFEYEHIRGQPLASLARNISPYLVDAANVVIASRTATPPSLPTLIKGSQPTDGGHLVLDDKERVALLSAEPDAKPWLRPFVGGDELLNGGKRWCLWLKDIPPATLKSMPLVSARVAAVAESRRKSPTKSVQEFAAKPTLFTQDRQPRSSYLAVPEVSSENRRFIPIGFLGANVIASNKLMIAPGATLYHLGVLSSTMHNAWMRTVAGRLKSDYSYSPAVYNNLPWPEPTEKQRAAVERAAQQLLDARAAHPQATLAELYDPIAMPPNLVDAHKRLDAVVDAAYGFKGTLESARVAFLFARYQEAQASRQLPLNVAAPPIKAPKPKKSPRGVRS